MEEPQYPCPKCGYESEIMEYDADEDAYYMKCTVDATHYWWYETDDEVWK